MTDFDYNNIQAEVTNGMILIQVPLSLVIFAQSQRPDFPLKIRNEIRASRWIEKHILHFGGDTEQGVSEFDLFLDKLFICACVPGEAIYGLA